MAQPEERVPRSIDDWIVLIPLIVVTLGFGVYTVEFCLSVVQMH